MPPPTKSSRSTGVIDRSAYGPFTMSFEVTDPPPACYISYEGLVFDWLREHKAAIIDAERQFQVSRLAIAGAIGWEALINIKPTRRYFMPSAVGTGKPHVRENYKVLPWMRRIPLPWLPGHVIVTDVEELGYLPVRTEAERIKILETFEGSATYIGAILSAVSDVCSEFGYQTRNDPKILTQFYQGDHSRSIQDLRDYLKTRTPGIPLLPGNEMPRWVDGHLDYLERAVGPPVIFPEYCTLIPPNILKPGGGK
jgi:hypothetical protein